MPSDGQGRPYGELAEKTPKPKPQVDAVALITSKNTPLQKLAFFATTPLGEPKSPKLTCNGSTRTTGSDLVVPLDLVARREQVSPPANVDLKRPQGVNISRAAALATQTWRRRSSRVGGIMTCRNNQQRDSRCKMGLIAAVIAAVLCAVVYVRMYKRELPEPIGRKQAAIPVALGAVSILLMVPVFIGVWYMALIIPGGLAGLVPSPVLRSLVSAFFMAGFTEELIKLLMFLIVVRVVKPKNVYEYGLLCAGVGIGFTGLEDIFYGMMSPVSSITRAIFFAMHMVFGLLMGVELGLAKLSKHAGTGDSGKHTLLALALPVLWHTVFDASTSNNPGITATDERGQIAGIVVALVVCAISIALQFVVLIRFKRDTEKLCGMTVVDDAQPAEAQE